MAEECDKGQVRCVHLYLLPGKRYARADSICKRYEQGCSDDNGDEMVKWARLTGQVPPLTMRSNESADGMPLDMGHEAPLSVYSSIDLCFSSPARDSCESPTAWWGGRRYPRLYTILSVDQREQFVRALYNAVNDRRQQPTRRSDQHVESMKDVQTPNRSTGPNPLISFRQLVEMTEPDERWQGWVRNEDRPEQLNRRRTKDEAERTKKRRRVSSFFWGLPVPSQSNHCLWK